MKKFLSLVLAALMLLGSVAMAQTVVQDEQPPKLVPAGEVDGAAVLATVYNAQGEVIAQITDEATVILTDAHGREDAENEAVSARLVSSYEGVMGDVHHADVECKLHEHEIKVDINTVLASLEQEIDAHDLVMYALFDVQFSAEVEALLVDGAYIQITLALEENQPLPLIVLNSDNGVDWSVISYESGAAKQITLKLDASSTVALLADGTKLMGIGEEPEEKETTIPGEGEEGGDNFTPSATGKPAPELEVIDDEDGNEYVGSIGNNLDDEKVLIPNRNYVLVTSLLESAKNYDVQTYEHLHWAFDSILKAANVGELYSDTHEGNIAADLDAVLAQMNLDLTHDQLVVKDLFEVTAYGDYLHYLYDENYYMELTFKTDLNPNQAVIVLHSADSVHWHIHPIEEATVHADGSITLNLYDLGAVALVVENPNPVNNGEAVVTAP